MASNGQLFIKATGANAIMDDRPITEARKIY